MMKLKVTHQKYPEVNLNQIKMNCSFQPIQVILYKLIFSPLNILFSTANSRPTVNPQFFSNPQMNLLEQQMTQPALNLLQRHLLTQSGYLGWPSSISSPVPVPSANFPLFGSSVLNGRNSTSLNFFPSPNRQKSNP